MTNSTETGSLSQVKTAQADIKWILIRHNGHYMYH